MTIHLTRSSLRGAAGWLCLRCSRATSTSLSSPSALKVWRQLHREAHNTARVVVPPVCTASIAIASFTGADTPLHVTSHKQISLSQRGAHHSIAVFLPRSLERFADVVPPANRGYRHQQEQDEMLIC